MNVEKRYLTIASAAAEAGIAQIRVWELIRSGAIAAECIRRSLFVEMSELEECLGADPGRHDMWRQNYRHAQDNKLLFMA